MTHNNNFYPLPWYPSLAYQNHRKSYSYGRIYPLYTQANFLLPWQIQTTLTGSIEFIRMSIYHEDGTLYQQATNVENNITIINASPYRYVVFNPIYPNVTSQPDGRYYAVFSMENLSGDKVVYYSEIYTVVQSLDGFLKIEWYDDQDLYYDGGKICYEGTSYRNFIYLPTELGKPEYEFEETGEDRDGYYYAEKQLSEKTYRFTFVAPEYLCDALRLVRLTDYVTVTDQFGYEYHADKFLMTPKWLNDGDLASVVVEFQTDTIVKKIGRGAVTGDYADFNNDYNDDYDMIDN